MVTNVRLVTVAPSLGEWSNPMRTGHHPVAPDQALPDPERPDIEADRALTANVASSLVAEYIRFVVEEWERERPDREGQG